MRIVPAIRSEIRRVAYKRVGDPGYSHRPAPGPEALTPEEIAQWIARDPELRGQLSRRMARALCFIDSFRPPPP